MDIFSASPRSFKVHRKSYAALRLKSFISRELRQFLADYRDDVLAEYITVLICNGKHQYQAKEDLEAFLGNRTVEFVSWYPEYETLLISYEIAAISPQDSDRCKGASTDRCEDFQSHSTGHDELLMKDNMTHQVSTCDPISSEDVKLAEGRPCLKQICANNNLGSRLSPGTGSLRSEKPRGSVWDRLGKPCEDIALGHTSVDFYGVGHKKQDGKVHNQLALIPPKRNLEAPALGQRSYGYPVETKKVENGGTAVGKPHTANNIGRKRLFGELSTDPGILKYSENNVEVDARTVLVTNVHFSATKEALSLFFANCGGVVNVVMLTDIVTAKRQGTAYVTFASKESVDKAVALSGTTFYSRTVKVLRKAEAASAATAPAQVSAKTFHAHVPHGNRKAIPNKPRYLRSSLQWRREPSIDPTEAEPPSAPASVKGVSSSAPKHLSDTERTATQST
ncbi:uncharacterized protein Pyn_22691 [Prunus yedoensis var. nudiflora]|uniref:RRM domain-containing protein n=1 Tax=Prunus yedoensis var. nudiflora TaxID=2094558 RepID=A0A314ZH59_PRUYE|nr:uncharacterized protein Pyn_22691 [Prunus yedoensis var. nudiflora]